MATKKLDDPRFAEQKNQCHAFWSELVEKMAEKGYVLQKSDTGTTAEYLFREGDEKYLSWLNKPKRSFRIADFWSWYANTDKCIAPPNYVQCLNVDFGWVKKRPDPIWGTHPKKGWAVAYTEDGYHYNTIFGRKFDGWSRKWEFITPSVDEVLNKLGF